MYDNILMIFGIVGDDRYDIFVPPARRREMQQILPSVPGAAWKATLYLLETADDGTARYGELDGKRRSIWLRATLQPDDTKGREYVPASGWWYPRRPPVVPVTPSAPAPAMTYAEARRAGWVPAGTALQRGYVSRLADPDDAEVHVAGGTRHGQMYVLLNNPRSNRYCIRQYLRRREVWEK